ncbi:MAG: hypothetical protein GY704_13325, partial [Phycisphaeraceae bacterium]|nr:hypothetical protein [Phycisphaeraceae bacterium]
MVSSGFRAMTSMLPNRRYGTDGSSPHAPFGGAQIGIKSRIRRGQPRGDELTRRRPRILFCATTPMNVAVFRPVLDALAADRRLDLALTARHGARAMVRSLDGPPLPDHVRLLGNLHARLRWTDLAICPGFYFRRGRVGTRVQMFHGVSFKAYAVNEKLRAFDEALVTGEYHHRLLVRAGLDSDCRLRRVGMPKTDPLVRGNLSRDRILGDLGLDPARP